MNKDMSTQNVDMSEVIEKIRKAIESDFEANSIYKSIYDQLYEMFKTGVLHDAGVFAVAEWGCFQYDLGKTRCGYKVFPYFYRDVIVLYAYIDYSYINYWNEEWEVSEINDLIVTVIKSNNDAATEISHGPIDKVIKEIVEKNQSDEDSDNQYIDLNVIILLALKDAYNSYIDELRSGRSENK